MKAFKLLFLILLIGGGSLLAQPMQIEVMAGNKYLFYQHSFSKQLTDHSRFGFKNIASVMGWYNTKEERGGKIHEIMNQTYVSLKLNSYFSLLGGAFFTNVTGMRGSAAIQFAVKKKELLLVLIPRVDILKGGAFEFFTMAEYTPHLIGKLKLYSRFQSMANFGPNHHNRGYQQFRLGLMQPKTQYGIAVNFDQYGEKLSSFSNVGFFIKRKID